MSRTRRHRRRHSNRRAARLWRAAILRGFLRAIAGPHDPNLYLYGKASW